MPTYTLRLARETSEYALIDVLAADDADAIAHARAILHDPDRFDDVFVEHSTGEGQWECGERIISLNDDDDGRMLIWSEEREPNHLRDAAPDLLEALRGVLASLEWHTQRNGNVGMDASRMLDARAAIAKATGTEAA